MKNTYVRKLMLNASIGQKSLEKVENKEEENKIEKKKFVEKA